MDGKMITIRKIIGLFLLVVLMASLTGCGSKSEKEDEPETTTVPWAESTFSAETNILYSAGEESDWSYGNQRKEFPADTACYMRVSSKLITSKKSGVEAPVAVEYRITGIDNCDVELVDGIASEKKTKDENVVVFSGVINPKTKRKASEDYLVFKYMPKGPGKVVLEVSYDELLPSKYDQRNTVYFVK